MRPTFLSSIVAALCACVSTQSDAAVYPKAFAKTRAAAAPYNLVGKLTYQHGANWYAASGTIIRPRSVLTAAHALYNSSTGFSRNATFDRIDSGANAAVQTATQVYVVGGYKAAVASKGRTSNAAFASDLGGVVFPASLAEGRKANWSGDYSLLWNSWVTKVSVGYASEKPYTGRQLTYVTAPKNFYQRYGLLYANNSVYFASGMSGGPTFIRGYGNKVYVSGVIVAGSKAPVMGAVRALDWSVGNFITKYLK